MSNRLGEGIYKDLLRVRGQEDKRPRQKWAKERKRHFSKEDT